ncbi:LysR family transcriptional regulator [Paracoccus sp. pheM1]|uniref:LysR family transcriptional regulator n=1 Tax=Paracoccus sp. pheM1 TaxID=2831675 RepID=UPI001BDB75A9|nr:LysR family transcriptional regulator [Paracoccus sp. pheM1]MBT0782828.1 LysR family transcriptional regulator [Paracoccus sp. pheM1]
MLDPRLLRAFVAIVDSGSFTRAAERLHMTQSTISQQLARLEDAAGHALIDRAARPVLPTPQGERLLGYARRILALQQEAAAALGDPSGTSSIRLGLPEDIFNPEMCGIFRDFTRQFPQIRLDVTVGLSRELMRRYRAAELDIVVVKEPAPESDCRAHFTEAMAWFESALLPRDWQDPVPLVVFPPGGLYRDAMFARIEREQRRWYVAFSGSSLPSVILGVEGGLGITLLPVAAVSGARLRRCDSFGGEPAMVVSIYSWESAGSIGRLIGEMTGLLSERHRRSLAAAGR